MAKQSSVNLDITNNADGFDISGGTTSRKLTVTGGDVTLSGTGNATITFPTTSTTLAGLDIAQTFTATQSFAAGFTSSGATFSGNIVANNIVNSVNSATGAVSVTGSGAILTTVSGTTTTFGARLASASATGVASFNNEFTVSAVGAVGLTSNYVKSVNGLTGAVTLIANLNTEQQFSAKKDFASGLSATNVGITGGFTASSNTIAFVSASTPNLVGRNIGGLLRVSSIDTNAAAPTTQGILIDGADSDLGGLGRVTLYGDEVFVDSTTFQVTGNQTISGTLRSNGVASFPGGVSVTGATFGGRMVINGGLSLTGGLTCFGYINLGGDAATDSVIRCVSANTLTIDANAASGVVKLGTNTSQFNPFATSTDLGNASQPWKVLYIQSITGCTFSGNVDYNRNAESNTTIRNYSEPFAYQVRKELATGKVNNTYYIDLTYGNTFYLDLAADNSGTLGNYASGSSKPSMFVKGDGNAVFNCTNGLTGATVTNVSGTVAVGQFIYAPGLTDTGVTAMAYNAGTGALTLSKAAVATVSTQYAAFATPNTVALGMVASPNANTASTKSPARVHTFTLMVEGTAGGAITWNTTANTYGQIKWPSGTAPTLTATRGKYDVFSFLSYDYGVTWLAFNAGQNF
jgi:cytoskeletal protein CcmA (bactofilin family)